MKESFAVGDKKKVQEVGEFVSMESHDRGYTLLEAKSMLFLSQIFHLLLPKNSPQPMQVKRGQDGGFSITYEKIPHDPLHAEVNRHRIDSHTSWEKRRGVFMPIDHPDLVRQREGNAQMNEKLAIVRDDLKYQALMKEIQDCGFGNLYELNPVNVIKDERNGEYVYIDPEPAITQYRAPGGVLRLGIPQTITQLRISLDNLKSVIERRLMGESRKMADEYLAKLRALLPKKHIETFESHHDSGVSEL